MHSKKLFGLAVAGIFAGVASFGMSSSADAACEPGKVAQKYPSIAGKTIKIGADPSTPPYVFRDSEDFNKLIGFDVELAKFVFDCAGVKTEYQLGGWSGLLPALVAGQIDVMWDTLYYTAERAEQVDYIIYMQAATGALTQAGNPKGIKSLEELCGNGTAVGLGTVEEAAMRSKSKECTDAGKKAIEIKTYPDMAAGFRLIANSRTDIVLTDLTQSMTMVKNEPKVYGLAFKIFTGFKIGAAVKNDNKDLLRAIQDGIAEAQSSAEQKKIHQKYVMDPELQLPVEVLLK
jgi:polar amino acid transport system substrate-binding protein